MTEPRPPLLPPPFFYDAESAAQKVRAAEDAWNNRNPQKASLASKPDSQWRNRLEFFNGREAIRAFLKRKWASELDYRLIKKLWAFTNNRIAVRFAFEWRDVNANGFRSYCDENWEFDAHSDMAVRRASTNDLPIQENERLFHWPDGPSPADHPGLSELSL